MPRRCVIINCLTKGSVANKSMYKFPKDDDLCKKWLEMIGNPKLNRIYETEGVYPLNKRVFVCSDHFETKWLRDVKEPSQGLFLGAIPTLNLNLSMETLLTNLRKIEMYKEFGLPRKVFNKVVNVDPTPVERPDLHSAHSIQRTSDVFRAPPRKPNICNMDNINKTNREIGFPTHNPVENNTSLTNLETPLDTLSVKDENLLSLIKQKKLTGKVDCAPKKVAVNRVRKVAVGKIRKPRNEQIRKNKIKKLKLRVKGTEKFINVVVTPKTADVNIPQQAETSQKTIKIFVPKNDEEVTNKQSKSIKVVLPNSINGEEVQLDRSEISKILNLVSAPKKSGNKQTKLEKQNLAQNVDNNETSVCQNDAFDKGETVEGDGASHIEDDKPVKVMKKKTVKLVKGSKQKMIFTKGAPLKSMYKKSAETNKSMREFIESYFGEMVKCACDFTPQENITTISQRIIDLKKKLVNAQKLLSKHKANNRKISNTIEDLRKQIPEKPVKPIQKGQLIKCIIPRSKVSERYRRGKHRFTKNLKNFALDLFYSSPLSYSILEKIYLLPSRKTLKRWLVHPMNSVSDLIGPHPGMGQLQPIPPSENHHIMHHPSPIHLHQMETSTLLTLHSGMHPMERPHEIVHHIETYDRTMGGIEDNIEPLQENIDDIMFRSDLAAAIMNT